MSEPRQVRTCDRSYYVGGLMRCCTATLHETTGLSKAGDVLNCNYCRAEMVVTPEGLWQWKEPAYE